MNIVTLLMTHVKKLKYIGIIMLVGVFTYFACLRWPDKFSPWWMWVGGAVLLATIATVIYYLVKRRHQSKMAAGLEAGIAEAEGDKVDLKGEIKALRESWQQSVKKLKETRGGGATLFSLPWYMIIGEPASGKSTLLRKSGLDFPVGDAAIAGMHGTRNCDWWFANEAIFLDTAGRYIIETQEVEWVAFLDLLRKYRKDKPVNGVLVAVAANSLLTKSHDELLLDGKRIRGRIDELIEKLGTNFPVYVLVTKCDLVGGFVEFFGSLDGRIREQMLGWTNPADADFRFDGEAFDQRFAEVSGRLFRMRPWLESSVKKTDLLKAFLYPEEFSYLGDPLRDVLDVVFRPNVYQETPVCRGVYFSSGTQVGSPLARALEDMAKDLNIPADFGFGLTMEEEKEIRTYFIKDLVAEQILKDKEMTWRTWQAEAKLKKRRMGWGLIGVAAAALLALFSTSSFLTNQGRLTDFKEVLPQQGRPTEVAKGCLIARDEAKMPGFLDIGLNFSDKVVPTIEQEFRGVTLSGCLTPLAEDLGKPIIDGPATTDGLPDIDAYVESWQKYRYLREALDGKLPYDSDPERKEAPPVPKDEEARMDAIFELLKTRDATGRGTRAQLRQVLIEYGGSVDVNFPRRRREEFEKEERELLLRFEAIDKAFLTNVDVFVKDIESWVDRNRDARGQLSGNMDKAIAGVKEACERYRNEIVPHETPEGLIEIAEAIKAAGNPQIYSASGAGGPKLTELVAGIASVEDLRGILLRVKEEVPPEGGIPPRVDALLKPLGEPLQTQALQAREKAHRRLIATLDGIIGEDAPQPLTFDREITRGILTDRRAEIKKEVEEAGETMFGKISEPVAALEGSPIVTDDGTGKMVRKEGWWDTLILLARAVKTDARSEEYLELGLEKFLAGERWVKERRREDDERTFSVEGIEEWILPTLREQTDFFGNELCATTLRQDGNQVSVDGFTAFLGQTDEFWRTRFADALPKAQPTSLNDAHQHLALWTDQRGDLILVTDEIKGALYDVTDITKQGDDPEDPLILESEDDRQRLFETFVVCFDPKDGRVRKFMTVMDASTNFEKLKNLLDPVVGGFGRGNPAEARKALADVMQGGRASYFSKSLETVRDLEKSTSNSPSALLGKWMKGTVGTAWSGLVNLVAEDINESWGRRRPDWKQRIESGGSTEFGTIFGDRGEFDSWREEYLEPFFTFPGMQPKPSQGTSLEGQGEFTAFLSKRKNLGTEVFSGGVFREERVTFLLGLGGTNRPQGLMVEYDSSNAEPVRSSEFRNDRDITFDLNWTPSNCRALVFKIQLNSGAREEMKWEGPWAVAKAFAEARQEGSKYIWTGKDSGGGTYEVWLTVNSRYQLIQLYLSSGGDPLKSFAASLPNVAVRVRNR